MGDMVPHSDGSGGAAGGGLAAASPGAAGLAPDSAAPRGDLADHFLACCKLGRYLTVSGGSRFVISDDFRQPPGEVEPAAAAIASIYSRDFLVAEAALLPLGRAAESLGGRARAKYERLFSLIEAQALSPSVKDSAHALLARDFREAEIRALEAELGHRLSPARMRYRQFLAVIARLMQGRISTTAFLEEFVDFTRAVAGKLDFGIYSFCIDRIFGNVRVPTKIKQVLAVEIMKYPPLVRRELMTNILTLPGQTAEVIAFIRRLAASQLDRAQLIEIELLEAVKASRLSMGEIEDRLRRGAPVGPLTQRA